MYKRPQSHNIFEWSGARVAASEAESDGGVPHQDRTSSKYRRFSGMRPSKLVVKMLLFPPLLKKYIYLSLDMAGNAFMNKFSHFAF